jgi:predicted helicase
VTWNRGLKNDLVRNTKITFKSENVRLSIYRPYFKQKLYFAKELNDMTYQIPKLFPQYDTKNLLICVSGLGGSKENTCLIVDKIPDLNMLDCGCQCFPLYYYEENNASQKSMFDEDNKSDYIRRDAISDFILERAKRIYGKNVTKEDIFYYVYGFLHSKKYRETFANDLKKMLPRLPLLEEVKDFWAFSNAGRKLADLHLNYETVVPFEDTKVSGDDGKFYTVDKMRFGKKTADENSKSKNVDDKSIINYNNKISISNIPEKAYEYVVNGKSAIEWIMERYQVSTHKESGIVNNPNDWANETGNPRYILDLLLSVINVSMQTVEIVNSLPKVNFEE